MSDLLTKKLKEERIMRRRRLLLFVALAAGACLLAVVSVASQKRAKNAADSSGFLLTGAIRSASGEALGGITVSAKAEGTTIATSVFTGDDGVYIFPPMEKGKYRVWAQAVGFNIARAEVDFAGPGTRRQDFTLRTIKDPWPQMDGPEMMASLPADTIEDRRMKLIVANSCAGCHVMAYTLLSRFDEPGWEKIIEMMSRIASPTGELSPDDRAPWPANKIHQHYKKEIAQYLAKVRGPQPFAGKLKLRPRPKGDAALAVITEYDIDSSNFSGEYPAQDGTDWSEGVGSVLNGVYGVHEAEIDFNGNIWIGVFIDNPNRTYAKIDRKTGKITDFKVLNEKGYVRGTHGFRKDQDGNIWFNLLAGKGVDPGKSSLARLDPLAGKLDVIDPPKGMSGVGGSVEVDGKGKIWAATRTGGMQFDPATGKFTEFKSIHFQTDRGIGSTYGVAADSQGNGWFAQFPIDILGKGEIATGKVTEIRFPPRADKMELFTEEDRKFFSSAGSNIQVAVPWAQGPRRLSADRNGDYVWAGDFWGENLARVDIRTNEIKFYPTPSNDAGAYSTAVDRSHIVWVNMENSDTLGRFDPATEKWTEYFLPTRGTETRQIAINDRVSPPEVVLPYWRMSKVARVNFRTRQDMQALREQVKREKLQAQVR
jgi:streptogramin lyase